MNLTVLYLLREPVTQTILARAATSYLTKKLNTQVNIEGLAITSFQMLSLKNILIEDLHNDTLIFSKRINLKLEKPFYISRTFSIENIQLDGAKFKLKKYSGEERSNIRFLMNFFTAKNADTIKEIKREDPIKEAFTLKEISIINSYFSYLNQHYSDTIDGVNFKDVAVKELNTSLKNLYIHADTFGLEIEYLSFKEKSGFVVDSLNGFFTMGNNFMQAGQLRAYTPLNMLDIDLKLVYDSLSDFKDFIHKVNIQSTIRPSLVNLSEVGYFAPILYPMKNRIKISGNVRGTVANFKAKNLKFGLGKTTQFRGDVQMNGLPDIRETFTHLRIKNFTTTIRDVSQYNLPTKPYSIVVPDILARLGTIRIQGNFTGFYNDFVSDARFNTGLGQINTDLSLQVNSDDVIDYNGHIAADGFNVGRFLDLGSEIGRLSMNSRINGSAFDFDHMTLKMDGIIDSLEFYDNIYNEIIIRGDLTDKKFTGQFVVKDEYLDLDFTGSLDYSQTIPAYNFSADIPLIYLDRINLIDRDESSKLSTRLTINILGNAADNMQGIIQLDSTVYTEKGEKFLMDDFMLSVTRESSEYAFINLYSDLLDASLEGDFKLVELKDRALQLLNLYFDKLIGQTLPDPESLAYQDFIFNIRLKNTAPLSKLFLPELEAKSGTYIAGGYNSQINNLFFDGKSPEIIFRGKVLEDWTVDFYMQDSSILLKSGVRKLVLSDTLQSDSLQLLISARDDTAYIQVNWDDYSTNPLSSGKLSGYLAFLNPDEYTFHFDQADFMFSDTLWHVNPANFMQVDSNRIQFHQMGFSSSEQGMFIHGGVSTHESDTIEFGFNNFDLSNFDLLLHNLNIDLDGFVNGGFKLIDYYNSPFYLSDLHIDSLKFNGEKLGEAELLSSWDPEAKSFDINGSIIYTGNIGKNRTLDITGNYYPSRSSENFNIDIALNKYKLKTLQPFLRSFSSEIEGMATGKMQIRGSKSNPDITGMIKLMRCGLRIDYTNVKYFFADEVYIDPNDIHFNNIKVYDSLNNKALLSGHIYHNHLKDFNFDLNINTDQVSGLNTTRSQNSIFYGQANISGTVRISGPVKNLNMAMDIRTEKGTEVKIPVSYDTEVGNNDYIVFINQDENEQQKVEEYKPDVTGVALQLGLALTNDANIQLFMPYNMGNIKAKGSGDIRMDIDAATNLIMDGEYVIDRGTFFFTLQNIINRTFDIQRGSKVTWTGDPYNAQINMKALYKVKTTLGEFGPPEDSATRVPVDCIIELRNQLLNPEIRFSIEFPDLKEDSKQYIYARLDTNDQAMMSQQMISLLVLNSFSSSTGYSGGVGFNTFSLVTNQINNWLSGISNDFDIGVNYRPGDELSAQEVEVALSTQLWDDRVLIDGNVGMKEDQSTQNTNNIVGEVMVEVKITPDGRFRAKAFNKSNNDYLYKNYSPYTQGVGVFYTQEFNKLNELFVKRKKRKNNTEETEKQ